MQLANEGSHLAVNLKRGGAIDELSLLGVPILRKEDGGHYQAALLFPFPNRLKEGKYEFEGKDYQFPQNDIHLPNALHGMVDDKQFTIEEQKENSVHLKLNYNGQEAAYPFPFVLNVTYVLEEGSLRIDFEVVNKGSGNMPCGFGWHPYYYTENFEETLLKTPVLKEVEIDEQMIPTGRKGPFNAFDDFENISKFDLDTCFKLQTQSDNYSSFLKLADGNTLEVWQDENFRYVQVFTPGEKNSVAIEPMTCNIDALNNKEGLKVLAPNDNWKMSFGIKLS